MEKVGLQAAQAQVCSALTTEFQLFSPQGLSKQPLFRQQHSICVGTHILWLKRLTPQVTKVTEDQNQHLLACPLVGFCLFVVFN